MLKLRQLVKPFPNHERDDILGTVILKHKNTNQSGFAIIEAFFTVLVIGVVIGGGWYVFQRKQAAQDPRQPSTASSSTRQSAEGPPLLLKSIGINLDKYDPATGKAGDIKFTSMDLQFDRLFSDYGFHIPGSSAGPAKNNPQPTFIVPLGTKVRSLVDGVVIQVPRLYSNDYSIMVAQDESSQYMYETEHVINPLVEKGDRVKAGQVIAEVSDYDSKNTPGYGLVEIGILKGGNPPTHVCPFAYLDPSIEAETFANLKDLYKFWNSYKGTPVYDVSDYSIPGCLSTSQIEG